MTPDHAEEARAAMIDDVVPGRAYQSAPVVGLGGSAGAIPALQAFFRSMPADSGLAFVVVVHLLPDHESTLASILQHCTSMPVNQVTQRQRVLPNHVYVIPPGKAIKAIDSYVVLSDDPLLPRGRHVAVDLFFRTLADTYGPHAAAVVLSGADGDGAIGIKRIKERGGLTVAQEPHEAEHAGMPNSAIGTGMVDWVLPVEEMAGRLMQYFQLENSLRLPPEDGPPPELLPVASPGSEEAQLREVLGLLRSRTGRDFSAYKRATVVRRIARRMQVNGVEDLSGYLSCLRTHPGEAAALLQDMLISVTNFFRDGDSFAALQAQLAGLLKGKGPNDTLRVWVAGCATGEEAYSVAMVLAEKARHVDAPPLIQVFATDLDGEAVRTARHGRYPAAIEADVSEDRLNRYFIKEHHGYKVRREIREMVLFAQHDLLMDSPFSRLDLVSCRNLLIYLNRDAQQRVFQTFHFALQPHGRLFLGASESAEDAAGLFSVLDKKNRILAKRAVARGELPLPVGTGFGAAANEVRQHALEVEPLRNWAFEVAVGGQDLKSERRTTSWGEMHFKLLEALAPPSVLVDADHEIRHLSTNAGRFLQFAGGEPSRNLLRAVHPGLRIELRAALLRAAQSRAPVDMTADSLELAGENFEVQLRVSPASSVGEDLFLVTFDARPLGVPAPAPPQRPEPGDVDPVAHQLDRELERLKAHLLETVEEYEASNEELKASNEELQAMNEELRSATEELETSREELQSINEELITVNQELKARVDELGHSNSDMHNLMDATAIATVFLDRELRITRYTPSAVSLFNLIGTDLGRPLADLATRLDYPELHNDAQKVLDRLVPIEREVGLPDGKWFLSRLLPYRTTDDRIAGVVASFIDITEQKQSAQALRSSEERLRLLVENATEFAIFSTDLQRRVTSWNSGAQRLLGYEENEVSGRPADIIFTDEDRAAGAPEHESQTALREGRASDDRMHQRKDGSRFWASGAMMLMRDAQGRAVGFVKILRDQTAARESQQALERSQAELMQALIENEQARAELQAADVAKDRFLAVLSHELRNPLASIDSAAALMLTPGVKAADWEAAAKVAKRQAGAMKSLLDDLLDVSRLKLGRLELHRERVQLASVIDGALQTIRPMLDAVGHRLTLNLPDYPIEIDADALRLGQVVSNLLTNAIKYTPPGGKIALSVRLDGPEAVLTVADNGQGIDPSQIQYMFEMFAQAQPVADRSHGLGIGLALIKSIVELHGGRVEAYSAGLGKGTEFRVMLPAVRRVSQRMSAEPQAAAGTSANDAPANKRGLILVADDNVDAGWGIAKLLEIAGFTTLRVKGGVEAVREAQRQHPDVGIIDIGMPDLSGHEVARQIRQAEWGQDMVLIAATGWGQESDEREAMQAGFDAHMTKPVDLRRLSAVVDDLLARKKLA